MKFKSTHPLWPNDDITATSAEDAANQMLSTFKNYAEESYFPEVHYSKKQYLEDSINSLYMDYLDSLELQGAIPKRTIKACWNIVRAAQSQKDARQLLLLQAAELNYRLRTRVADIMPAIEDAEDLYICLGKKSTGHTLNQFEKCLV